jgi:hypothetical protein
VSGSLATTRTQQWQGTLHSGEHVAEQHALSHPPTLNRVLVAVSQMLVLSLRRELPGSSCSARCCNNLRGST